VAKWRALTGMNSQAGRTDPYHGHFVKLMPDEQVVEDLRTAAPMLL
jgi:hypothetical protein